MRNSIVASLACFAAALCLCLIMADAIVGQQQSPKATKHGEQPHVVEEFYSVFAKRVPALRPGQVLVHRHIYVAAVDTEAKQPAWVAYRVSRSDWDTQNVLERNFSTPDSMKDILLEQSDFEGSGFDLGHLYGLQFVSANEYAHEVNELCAIAAQRASLNRGPWLRVENRIRTASSEKPVSVLAGQLWIDEMPPLPQANEPHKVASHCWMIFGADGAEEEAYLFPQSVNAMDDISIYRTDSAELRSKISDKWLEAQ